MSYIVKTSKFVYEPVKLEEVEVSVAEDRPLVDGCPCGDTEALLNRTVIEAMCSTFRLKCSKMANKQNVRKQPCK